MSEIYRLIPGEQPLLISVPHDGRDIPDEIKSRMTDAGRAMPDTDWHVAELYEFARDIGASMLIANYSRYVIDLNRSAADEALYPGQVATGLCPLKTFAGVPIYADTDGLNDAEKERRIDTYWRPYHACIADTLAALRTQHGYALLWDAHSIPSLVPRLFDGQLPALNLGSNSAKSCASFIEQAVAAVANDSPYSNVVNGRFKGGYITRHYGDPARHIHALQLEIAQRVYMDETSSHFDVTKAAKLRDTLRQMLRTYLDAAKNG